MVIRIALIAFLTFCMYSCGGKNTNIVSAFTTASPIKINRFDKSLFELINKPDSTGFERLKEEYPAMVDLTGKAILNMQSTDMPGFYEKITAYYSEPTLYKLYQDAIGQYDDITSIEDDLGNAFAWVKTSFPDINIPNVYLHVSGLNQNILVADSLISLSIDKYMGTDYPLYTEFFYEKQRRKMSSEFIVPDYVAGLLMSEFPFSGKENVLLERMVYEGKIKYLINKALPNISPAQLLGYTENEYNWCKKNEEQIWKAIVERKHLYTPDQTTTSRYFDDMSGNVLSDEIPGNIGAFIGWQIIDRYMNESNATAETLMRNNDAQAILAASKYKP